MPPPSLTKINEVKNEIINTSLVAGALLGIVTYAISLSSFFTSGFEISFVTDFLIIAIICVVAYYRKRISNVVKSYFILVGLYVVILVDVYELGILSANKVLLILIPFLAIFNITVRQTTYALILILLSIGALGYMHMNGMLTPVSNDVNTLAAWVINIILILLVASVLLLMVRKFNTTYESLIEEITMTHQVSEEKEKNYQEIFNATSDAIIILNKDYTVIDYNKSVGQFFGEGRIERESSLEHLVNTNGEYDYNQFELQFSTLGSDSRVVFDWLVLDANQEEKWVEISLKKAKIGGNETILCGIRNNHEKITTSIELEKHKNQLEILVEKRTKKLNNQKNELKKALEKLQDTQDRLVHSEKMASLGLLASGIAHEINNPLNFIKGGIYGIEEYLKNLESSNEDEQLRELLEGVNNGIERAAKIVTSLSLYGREQDTLKEEVILPDVINNCITILGNEIRNKVKLQLDVEDEHIRIKGNSSKLHQVFLNLMTNSIQAIQNEGEISIRITTKKKKAIVQIDDTGVGIPENLIKRISDPFFTTKQVGEGTGLGLYIVFNILKEHNGSIEFNSKVGIGTSVIISLPLN